MDVSCGHFHSQHKALFVTGCVCLICKLFFMRVFNEHPAVRVSRGYCLFRGFSTVGSVVTNQIKAYFSPASCRNCPHAAHCTVKIRSKSGLVVVSRTAIERAKQQRRMTGDTFQNWQRIRNGVESIPSILRNRFDVDKIPTCGKFPSKFYFGAKISAVNFRKLFRFRKGLGWHPYNPIIAGNAN